ncbi:hypothetical protein J2T13_000117 [Paenibacillus sp. DS2015]|uniref:hypothetical protein n=1 Tax=Paenibacillus sp. DS2015 TaxID=3373917 RepID=UPI003D19D34F
MDFIFLMYLLLLVGSIVIPIVCYKKYRVSSVIFIVIHGMLIVGGVLLWMWTSGNAYVILILILLSIPMYVAAYISLIVEFIIKNRSVQE